MLSKSHIYVAVLLGLTCVAHLASPIAGHAAGDLKSGDKIVFFGDSITWGAGRPDGFITMIKNSIGSRHHDLQVEYVNAGVRGNKAFDLANRLEKDVLDQKPTIVFIFIGVNDVWHGRDDAASAQRYESSLADIAKRLKKAGIRVVLCTPAVMGEKSDGTNPKDKMMDKFADLSRKVAADEKVEMIDLRKSFLEYLKANNKENKEKGVLTKDTVHLTPEGNKFVAREMLKVLNVEFVDVPVAAKPAKAGRKAPAPAAVK